LHRRAAAQPQRSHHGGIQVAGPHCRVQQLELHVEVGLVLDFVLQDGGCEAEQRQSPADSAESWSCIARYNLKGSTAAPVPHLHHTCPPVCCSRRHLLHTRLHLRLVLGTSPLLLLLLPIRMHNNIYTQIPGRWLLGDTGDPTLHGLHHHSLSSPHHCPRPRLPQGCPTQTAPHHLHHLGHNLAVVLKLTPR
jgi:hypothetical protein